jgi:hypothetical protein
VRAGVTAGGMVSDSKQKRLANNSALSGVNGRTFASRGEYGILKNTVFLALFYRPLKRAHVAWLQLRSTVFKHHKGSNAKARGAARGAQPLESQFDRRYLQRLRAHDSER